MPVVACDCGKNLRVPDEYVGKRLQCPACGSVQRVEDRTAGGTALATVETVRVRCDCGKRFRVDAAYAGRVGKCPGCGEKVAIPAPEYDPIAAPDPDEPPLGSRIDAMLARKKAAAEAEDAAPKKGKKGKKKAGSMVPAMFLLGVVFAAAAGAAYYFLFMQDGTSGPITKGPETNTQSQSRPGDGDAAQALALVPGDAAAFATVRVGDLVTTNLAKEILALLPEPATRNLKQFEDAVGLTLADLDRVVVVAPTLGSLLAVAGMGPQAEPDVYVVVTSRNPFDQKKLLALLGPGTMSASHNGKAISARGRAGLYFHGETAVAVGLLPGLYKAIDQAVQPRTDGPLAALVADAGTHHLALGVIPPAEQMAMLRQDLPKEAEPFLALLDAQSVRLFADVTAAPAVDLDLAAGFPDAAKAEAAKAALDGLKRAAGGLVAGAKGVPAEVGKALDGMAVAQDGTTARVSASVPIDPKAIKAAFDQVGGSAAKITSQNNLKQIGLAIHSHESATGALPAWATADAQRKPLLSWRVAILPYLEQDPLYRQIRLNEPWDSEHNKQFHDKMPKVFEMPGKPAEAGKTYYQAFVGRGAIFGKDAAQPTRFAQIKDGASNTLLAVEAATPVNWMEPKDIDFAAGPNGFAPEGKVGGHFPGGFHALFADGSVRFLPLTVPAKDLQALITAAGAEVVPPRTP